jgi:thiol-disulfide isomerase/thioredoxin
MHRKNRETLALSLGCVLVIGLCVFGGPLRSSFSRQAVLGNPMPPPELVEELIEKSPDPSTAIVAAWNTRKIVHRQAAMRQISHLFSLGKPLPAEVESIVLDGALDADMDVREIAFGILNQWNHSTLASLAGAQLKDADPQVRLIGLNALKRVGSQIGAPMTLPLLDDGDPLIVATALKLLENWSVESFGVMLRDTASFENPVTGLKEFPEGSREKARAGADRAKAWWSKHQTEFSPVPVARARDEIAVPTPIPTGDFSLRDLDGRSIRMADLRGKVVLINFWTTWCSACLSEMPELIALQKSYGDRSAIIGVSLDFVPDSRGHIGGHAAAEEQRGDADDDSHKSGAAALKRVQEEVRRTVKARGINYRVLLDEKDEVGGRFNGGELPTTIIIDSNGLIRRRFVGARSLAVFEAMISEANAPQKLALNR